MADEEATEEIKDEDKAEDVETQSQDTTETEQPDEKTETVDQSENEATGDESSDEVEPEGIEIEIDGETPDPEQEEFKGQPAPQWAKDLRKRNTEQAKELKAFRDKEKNVEAAKADLVLGPRPKIFDDGIDGDDDVYAKKTDEWLTKKSKIDSKKEEEDSKITKQDDEWKKTLSTYEEKKKALKVPDFESAEDVVTGSLSITQQSIIISAAESPEVVVYALSKNPKLLETLSSIENPVKFAVAMGKLESRMKVKPRKVTTRPETVVHGRNNKAGVGANREALEKEAEKTGARSKIVALNRVEREAALAK